VRIVLGEAPVTTCPAMDAGSDGRVTVNELVRAVRHALNGCEAEPAGLRSGLD
jgi:hypothetical protein